MAIVAVCLVSRFCQRFVPSIGNIYHILFHTHTTHPFVWTYTFGMETFRGQWHLVDTIFQNGWLFVDILKGWLLVDTFGDILRTLFCVRPSLNTQSCNRTYHNRPPTFFMYWPGCPNGPETEISYHHKPLNAGLGIKTGDGMESCN